MSVASVPLHLPSVYDTDTLVPTSWKSALLVLLETKEEETVFVVVIL